MGLLSQSSTRGSCHRHVALVGSREPQRYGRTDRLVGRDFRDVRARWSGGRPNRIGKPWLAKPLGGSELDRWGCAPDFICVGRGATEGSHVSPRPVSLAQLLRSQSTHAVPVLGLGNFLFSV